MAELSYDEIEDRIAELRGGVKAAEAEYDRQVAVLRADLDRKVSKSRDELAALHEQAARLIRGEPEEATETEDENESPPRPLPKLLLPPNATVEDWARKILTATDKDRDGLHFKEVADLALRLGYDSPGADIKTAHTSFRRTMSKKNEVFEQMGGGVYRLKNGE